MDIENALANRQASNKLAGILDYFWFHRTLSKAWSLHHGSPLLDEGDRLAYLLVCDLWNQARKNS